MSEVPPLAFDRFGPEPREAAQSASGRVVMLHGFLGSGRNLATLARTFAAATGAVVLTPDLAGHGRSPALAPLADLHSLAADVLALARAVFGADAPFDLVGHSLGGRVALCALDRDPDAVSRVMLLDISPGPQREGGLGATTLPGLLEAPARFDDRASARAHFARVGLGGAFGEWLLMNLTPSDRGLVWRIDRAALAALLPRVLGADLWPVVERHRARVHALRGGDSPHVSDADAKHFEALTGRTVTTLAGAGHFVHAQQPADVLRVLASFAPGLARRSPEKP